MVGPGGAWREGGGEVQHDDKVPRHCRSASIPFFELEIVTETAASVVAALPSDQA